MNEQPYQFGKEEMKQLLLSYHKLKFGKAHSFLDEDSFVALIDYFEDEENIKEAANAANIGLEHFPYSAEIMFRKADILIINRKYEQALELLETAALYDAANISLYILKTDALLALDRQAEAVEILQTALELFEGEEKIDLLFDLADVYDDYEEFEKVFDCLVLILQQDPTNDEALYKICFWTDFTGRFEESITLHNKIIDEQPYSEVAWFNLATALQGLKLYEKAIDAYKYAIAIDDKFDYAYRNMGDAYLRMRKYKDAIEMLEKVLELTHPEDVIYEALGHCYQRLGNMSQARFHYKKAVHLNSTDSKLHYKVAITYMNEMLWEMAIKHLENALRLNKNNKDYNIAFGTCKMQLGLYNEALQCFGQIVLLKPKNIGGWEALICCLFKAKKLPEAQERCEAALHYTEQKPIFYFYLAAALFAQGKIKEGLVQLETAMIAAPKLYKTLLNLMPEVLQNIQIVEMICNYKKKK